MLPTRRQTGQSHEELATGATLRPVRVATPPTVSSARARASIGATGAPVKGSVFGGWLTRGGLTGVLLTRDGSTLGVRCDGVRVVLTPST